MDAPTLYDFEAARSELADWIVETPVHRWRGGLLEQLLGRDAEVWCKLELLQMTGSFKARAAVLNLLRLPNEARTRGIVAFSAGNHAIACAYAAAELGVSAKVVMFQGVNPVRLAKCRAYGAEVIIADDVKDARVRMEAIAEEEGRTIIHPFEGPNVTLGTGTLGIELMRQAPQLHAVVVPVGGGGLLSGIAVAVKRINRACAVFGVEPTGADTMSRSLAAGEPVSADRIETIADSLGAPNAMPYSFALARKFVDDVVTVDDDMLRGAMALLADEMKLAVEPAAAAATAAVLGPLQTALRGRKVGLVICGTNTDLDTFTDAAGAGQSLVSAWRRAAAENTDEAA